MSDLRQWLDSLGLGEYAEAFAENAVDSRTLHALTEDDLKELGLKLGHRRILQRAIAALNGETPVQSGHDDAKWKGTPHSTPAERRQLTVMFCDLVGSVELAQRMDIEDYRDLLARFRAVAVSAVERFDGFIARHQGDGLLVYFGFPQARENDAKRAVKTGLEILHAVKTLDHPHAETPRVRIGIATGPAIVGDLLDTGGTPEFAALGATPNLAARLQGEAKPDSVLVSAMTKRLVEGDFALEPTAALELKGIAEPIVAYRVLRENESPAYTRTTDPGTLSSLVGREAELALLLDRWAKAKQGSGQAVLVSAEPGVGKSRLVRELENRLARGGTTPIALHCSPYHTGSTLHPLVDAIQHALAARHERSGASGIDELVAWLDELDIDVASVARVIAPLLSLSVPDVTPAPVLTGDEYRSRTLNAFTAIINAHTARAPVLLIAEDLQWADATTLELLERIIDQGRDQPLLAVLTFRPEFASAWTRQSHVTTLSLNHLTRSESRDFVAQLGPAMAMSEETVEKIVERTDGIPLFIEELARSLVETGESAAAIPETLRDALTARLDRLGRAKEIAQLASVIGRQFSRGLLAALFEGSESQLDKGINALLASGLVSQHRTVAGERYEFKHALVRDTAYESLLKRRLQTLHARLMEHLECASEDQTEPPLELLAHHARAARAWRKALDYSHQAGTRAASRGANREALALFDEAVDAVTHLPPSDELSRELIAVRRELRTPLHALGHTERLEVELQAAVSAAEALGDRYEVTILRTYLSNLYRHRGAVKDALSAAQQAHAIARELEDRTLVICSAYDLAHAEYVVGRLHHCIEGCTRGLALIDPDEAGAGFGRPAPASVMFRVLRAEALADLGELSTAKEQALETVALADSLEHQMGRIAARWAISVTDYWQGELASAAESLEAMLDIVRRERIRLWLLHPGWKLVELFVRRGRGEEAIALSHEAIETNRALGYDLLTGRLLAARGFALSKLGRQDEAENQVREGVRLASGRDAVGEAWCGWIAGQVIADPDEASRQVQRAFAMATRLEMRPLAALCSMEIARRSIGVANETVVSELRGLGMTGWAELPG